ncbi:hypothetical protein [Verrucosispora sp. SN26_14.1]|nr:hypothetical protein [Verrucosispora sp. SN26_14.1]
MVVNMLVGGSVKRWWWRRRGRGPLLDRVGPATAYPEQAGAYRAGACR